MIRILHIVRARHMAGSELMAFTLGMCQQRRGHQVFFAVPAHCELRDHLLAEGLQVIDAPYEGWRTWHDMIAFCRANEVQIVHAHLTSATGTAVLISLFSRALPVTHAHIYSRDPSYRWAARRGALIAVSKHMARHFEKLGVPPERIATIWNATLIQEQPDAVRPREALRREVLEELGLGEDTRLLLLPGRVTEQKGQDFLVEAMPAILDVAPSTHVLLPGEEHHADYVEAVHRRIAELGVGEHMHFLGLRRDMTRLNRAADVVVMPSRWDPFPLTAIEALMLGRPLVAMAVGGIPEMLDREELGVLVPPEDPAALARATGELLVDPQRAERMGRAAHAEALKRFTPDAMTDGVDRLYRRLLDKAR